MERYTTNEVLFDSDREVSYENGDISIFPKKITHLY